MAGKGAKAVNMTGGNIARHLLQFALPLLAGNLFQMLYNLVDSWTLGNYDTNEAFSAVGIVSSIVNMLIGAFQGFSVGVSVVISQYFGAGNKEKVRDSVHTAMLACLVISVLFTVFALVASPFLVRILRADPIVSEKALTYLRIYFGGMIGLLVYNMGSAILRAIGDSRRPFYYLAVCAVVNIILDLYFVIKLHWSVAGVAWATILSQFVSAILVVITLIRTSAWVKLEPKRLKIDWQLLKMMITIGLPNAVQMAVVSFSNIFVQGYIDFFGNDVISGWTAYLKLDGIILLPITSVSQSVMTFVGQNLGIGNRERAKKGLSTGLKLSLVITGLMALLIMFIAPECVRIFNKKPEVIHYGALFLTILTPLEIFAAINQILAGALRGAGDSMPPMIIMVLSFSLARQIYLFICANYVSNTVLPIIMGYPFGWLICSIGLYLYYRKYGMSRKILLAENRG